LAPDRRTDLVVELSRTLAEHAEYASPQQRDELWDRALQVVEDELTRKPLRAELLTAQAALARARQSAAQADSDWLAAFSRLNHALGRLPALIHQGNP
jgi:hypothetical protein